MRAEKGKYVYARRFCRRAYFCIETPPSRAPRRRRAARQKRRTTALGTNGARLLRLIKRSAPPSQANFDKYRHVRPKKLFRKGAVPTRGRAEPLDGRSASERRIVFVPWQKCAFCAFAVDAPKPPYGATALRKSHRDAEKIINSKIRRAFEVPGNPGEAPRPQSCGAGRLREESRLSIRRRPVRVHSGKSAPPSARAAERFCPSPAAFGKGGGPYFCAGFVRIRLPQQAVGDSFEKRIPHGKTRRPLSDPIFSQQNSSNRE